MFDSGIGAVRVVGAVGKGRRCTKFKNDDHDRDHSDGLKMVSAGSYPHLQKLHNR